MVAISTRSLKFKNVHDQAGFGRLQFNNLSPFFLPRNALLPRFTIYGLLCWGSHEHVVKKLSTRVRPLGLLVRRLTAACITCRAFCFETPTMASNSDENDQVWIGKQCLGLSKTLTNQGLILKFSLSIGSVWTPLGYETQSQHQ